MTPAAQREALQAYVGQTLHERYRIDAVLGMGGMGGVFRAHHLGLDQDVAIKMLHASGRGNAIARGRFEREARAASRLDHPNCVRVSDFGALEDGTLFLVMQLLRGEELRSRLGTPWAVGDAIDIAMQILDGLAHAHRHGVVHRDLKPENVFLATDHRGARQVKLVDFGIAKIIEGDGSHSEVRLTRTGMSFGTPRYMSPEQVGGGKVDARTDLYAVGLLLHELIAGKPPFEAENAAMVMRMHVLADPPPLPEGVPASLNGVVAKLLAKSPADRFESAEATMQALEAVRAELEAGTAARLPSPDAPPRSGGTVLASTSAPVLDPVSTTAPPRSGGTLVAPTSPTPSGWASAPTTLSEAAMTSSQVTIPTYGPDPQQAVAGGRRTRRRFQFVGAIVAVVSIGLAAAAGLYFGGVPPSARGTPPYADLGRTGASSAPTESSPVAAPSKPLRVRLCSGDECECRGSDPCNLRCGEDCDLNCERSTDCTFVCGEDCKAECEGSGNCTVTARHDSKITCSGSGNCDVTCQGECSLKCRGTGRCNLRCADPNQAPPKRCKTKGTVACGECD